MEIIIVTTERERDEYLKVIDAYGQVSCGSMTNEEYDKLPRKVWVDLVNPDGRTSSPFIVVDNQDGNCWVEEFETLDGALLYATNTKLTTEGQEDWDYMGALKDGGDIIERLVHGSEED